MRRCFLPLFVLACMAAAFAFIEPAARTSAQTAAQEPKPLELKGEWIELSEIPVGSYCAGGWKAIEGAVTLGPAVLTVGRGCGARVRAWNARWGAGRRAPAKSPTVTPSHLRRTPSTSRPSGGRHLGWPCRKSLSWSGKRRPGRPWPTSRGGAVQV